MLSISRTIYLWIAIYNSSFLFFQVDDGIRAGHVTRVQTCALPISAPSRSWRHPVGPRNPDHIEPTVLSEDLEHRGQIAGRDQHLHSHRTHTQRAPLVDAPHDGIGHEHPGAGPVDRKSVV